MLVITVEKSAQSATHLIVAGWVRKANKMNLDVVRHLVVNPCIKVKLLFLLPIVTKIIVPPSSLSKTKKRRKAEKAANSNQEKSPDEQVEEVDNILNKLKLEDVNPGTKVKNIETYAKKNGLVQNFVITKNCNFFPILINFG